MFFGMNQIVQEYFPKLSSFVGLEIDSDPIEVEDIRLILNRVEEQFIDMRQ